MDQQKVDMFLMTNGKYFDGAFLATVRDMLLRMDDSRFILLQSSNFKDPTIVLILSILGGSFGIDRFFIGDTGLGIAKLLTCGGLGIWQIVDWFLIMGRTREVNMTKLQRVTF
jgi:TM2 domain-containing membrane protein YozV